MSYQVEMVNLEELVSKTHQYRKFTKEFKFSEIEKELSTVEKDGAYKGYGVFRLINTPAASSGVSRGSYPSSRRKRQEFHP